MIPNFIPQLIAVLSIVAGLFSIAATIAAYAQDRIRERRKLLDADERDFETALKSTDIQVLGNYLETKIGRFSVEEYVTSQQVAIRVSRFLHRLREFLGSPDEMKLEEEYSRAWQTHRTSEPQRQFFAERLDSDAIWSDLVLGKTWNALAKLRLSMEMELREVARSKGLPEQNLQSATQLLQVLFVAQVLDSDTAGVLRTAIAICNRAIHGLHVSADEAVVAVSATQQALRKLRNLRNR